jgi:hypothetical protein
MWLPWIVRLPIAIYKYDPSEGSTWILDLCFEEWSSKKGDILILKLVINRLDNQVYLFSFLCVVEPLLFYKMVGNTNFKTYLTVQAVQVSGCQFDNSVFQNGHISCSWHQNETTNSPIHEFKELNKGQRAFSNPFLMMYYFLFITLKSSTPCFLFQRHFEALQIRELVNSFFWCHKQVISFENFMTHASYFWSSHISFANLRQFLKKSRIKHCQVDIL